MKISQHSWGRQFIPWFCRRQYRPRNERIGAVEWTRRIHCFWAQKGFDAGPLESVLQTQHNSARWHIPMHFQFLSVAWGGRLQGIEILLTSLTYQSQLTPSDGVGAIRCWVDVGVTRRCRLKQMFRSSRLSEIAIFTGAAYTLLNHATIHACR